MAFAAERPQINRVATKTTTYTMTDDDAVILANAVAGAFTVTTPDATSVKTGVVYTVVKVDSTAFAVTVDGSGAQTINGAATQSLSVQYQSITIASDGANWYQVSAYGLLPLGTPGGELGGTWASPTVDATHSGSAHVTAHSGLSGLTADDHTQYVLESLFDAQGDMLVASADNTPAKLSAPTALGQVATYQTAANKVGWIVMPSFIGSNRSSNITSATGTGYLGAFGTAVLTEANANTLVPVAGRIYNLHVYATNNTLDGTMVCTLRQNGAGTALTVTIAAGSTATASDLTNVVTLAVADKICLEVVENATAGAANIHWSAALRPDVA